MDLWMGSARACSRKVSIALASDTLHRRIVYLCRLLGRPKVCRSAATQSRQYSYRDPVPTSSITTTALITSTAISMLAFTTPFGLDDLLARAFCFSSSLT